MKFTSLIQKIIIGAGFLSAAWLFAAFISHAAPQNPPSNNAPQPVHVGAENQTKNGDLSVGSIVVDPGAAAIGKIGIGVTSVGAGAMLEVKGTLRIRDGAGTGKKVLVSDGNGYAHWEDLETGGAGPQGPQGDPGPQGPKGPAGPPGPPGS